ncbi:MAG: sulfotransferase [Crocinitomicaceae bacterium]
MQNGGVMWSSEEIDALPVHFIFCTERTGSSLLTAMLNMHPEVLVASEEPFALYFYRRYGKKIRWTEKEITIFTEQFARLFEKNFNLYFDSKEALKAELMHHAKALSYDRLIKLCYLHFYDSRCKEKGGIRVLIDKQMKYVFHQSFIEKTFPDAKIIVLTRDVIPNVKAKHRRRIDYLSHPLYLAHLWKNTYRRCLRFKSITLISFEDLIDQPEEVLATLNRALDVPYYEGQLEYSAGFNALLKAREDRLSKEFIAKLKDFHRGLLKEPLQGSETILNGKHERLILHKTYEIRQQLGYEAKVLPSAFGFTDHFRWFFYGMLATLGRTGLWKTYACIPLWIKLRIRRKKESA